MPTLIHIPRNNGRFDGNAPIAINGTLMRIPVGVDYQASDAEIAALTNAGIWYQRMVVPAGSIFISANRYGSRVTIGLNGVITILPTGVAFVPTDAQRAALDGKGIVYTVGGGTVPAGALTLSNLEPIQLSDGSYLELAA